MLFLTKALNKVFYGWVVVAGLFVASISLSGVRFSFGVFLKSLASEFALSRAATSSVYSLYMLLGSFFAVAAGLSFDRYGPRIIILLMGIFAGMGLLLTSQANAPWQLYITYSLLLALGTSSTYLIAMSAVSRWFDRKRGLALGIAGSGAGMGMLAWAPLATFLIDNFDWRMAYIIMGVVVMLVVLPLSQLLKRDPHEIRTLPDGEEADLTPAPLAGRKAEGIASLPARLRMVEVFKARSFWLIMFIWFGFATNLSLVITHLVPHITDLGFSAEKAAAIFGLIGGASIFGRVLMGAVSDRIGGKKACIIAALIQAVSMLWLVWWHDMRIFYLFAVVFGFAYGGMAPLIPEIVADAFGLDKIGSILGTVELGFGAGSAVGSAMGGLIFDVRHSYSVAFLTGGVVLLLVAMLTALIKKETDKGIAAFAG